jgi:uncharacterized protein (TIGR02996 family)
MPDLEGLLREIQARPDEDAPRLIYADWLEEHGDPDRAEFIRVQCQLARLSLWDRRRRDLTRREYELFARHANRWSADLITRVPRWQFRRGFVEQIKAEPRHLTRHAEMLWRLFPVREVLLEHPERAEIRKVAHSPWLARVEKLDLTHSRMGDDGLRLLLGSPHTHGLRGLTLRFCRLSAGGLRLLARAANLPALEQLDLSANEDAGPEGVAAFLAECRLPRAADVRWGFDGWSAEVCAALASSPLLPRIKTLEHFGHETPNEAVFNLLANGHWEGLEHLDLSRRLTTTEQARALAANSSFSGLCKLDVSGGPLGDEGLAALVRSPIALNLQDLRLRNCGITGRGVRELARSPVLAHLAFLDLGRNPIGDGGCRALAEAKTLGGLQGLSLADCGLSSRAARPLAGLEGRLGYLDFENDRLGARARGELEERFGERLERADQRDRDWTDWHVAQARAHPPRCLSGFAARADSPLARRVWEQEMGRDPEYAVFELAHPGEDAQRPAVLGYWLRPNTSRVFLSPLAVRWQPSGEVVELFDAEQHGYAGEHGGSCEATGTGPRAPWNCPHKGCREHTLLAGFRYRDWGAERPLHRYFPPQEQFRMFDLYAYCHRRDAFVCIACMECK